MMLRDGEYNRLAGPDRLTWREVLIIRPSEAVEFLHHLSIRILVGPLAFKLGGVIRLLVYFCAFSKDYGYSSGELVWHQITIGHCLLDGKREVWLTITALIKLKRVSLNIRRWCCCE